MARADLLDVPDVERVLYDTPAKGRAVMPTQSEVAVLVAMDEFTRLLRIVDYVDAKSMTREILRAKEKVSLKLREECDSRK